MADYGSTAESTRRKQSALSMSIRHTLTNATREDVSSNEMDKAKDRIIIEFDRATRNFNDKQRQFLAKELSTVFQVAGQGWEEDEEDDWR